MDTTKARCVIDYDWYKICVVEYCGSLQKKREDAEADFPIRPDAFMDVHDGCDLVYASDNPT
jgi:hypothetical protein